MKTCLLAIMFLFLFLFVGAGSGDTLQQYYPDSNTDSMRSLRNSSGYYDYQAQAFVASAAYNVSTVILNMSKHAGHPGNFWCYIYGANGTPGTDAYPNQTRIGTSATVTTAITTTPQLVNFTFSPTIPLTSGTSYTIVVHTDQSSTYQAFVGADVTSPTYANGNFASHPFVNNWSTWSAYSTRDMIFYIYSSASSAPVITSYAPTGSIYPEVYDSQTFNVTTTSAACNWYLNGSLVQTNTSSTTHAYTNSSLHSRTWNVTADVYDAGGNDTQTWIFEVGADSVTFVVLQDDPTNQSRIAEWNVTRIGSNVTGWSHNQSHTFGGWNYTMRHGNGNAIVSHTATYTNQTLLFNGTSLLPCGIYYIDAESYTLTAAANQYYMFNNWTSDRTFTQIAANEGNDVVYTWYNHTSGLHESYYVGRSYNANKIVPVNCSVSCFFNAQTTITPTTRSTAAIVGATWFNAFLLGAADMTPAEIKASMDADGLDCWVVYRWAGTGYATTGDAKPCEGLTVYCNNTGEWTI